MPFVSAANLMITAQAQDRASQALVAIQQRLEALDKSAKHAEASSSSAAGGFGKMAVAATALAGTLLAYKAGIEGVVVKSITLSGQLEQTKIAFETMLRSARKADAMIRELFDFAKRTPFQIKDVISGARLLKAYGFEAAQIIPTLTAVGNAAAGLGLSGEGIDRIVIALGQMRAKGAMAGEEMRQLAQAGIPAWEMLAEIIGVDIPTAMKMAEEKAIPAAAVIDQLIVKIGERYPDLMAKQAKTLLGLWSNLQDQGTITFMALGDAMVKNLDLKERLAGMISALEGFTGLIESKGLAGALQRIIPPEMQAVIVAVAGAISGVMVAALIALGAAAIAALGPLALLGVAGTVLAIGWQQNWGGMRDIANTVVTEVGSALEKLDTNTRKVSKSIHDSHGIMERATIGFITSTRVMSAATQAVMDVLGANLIGANRNWQEAMRIRREGIDRDYEAIRREARRTTAELKSELGFWANIFGSTADRIQGEMGRIKKAMHEGMGEETWLETFRRQNAGIIAETKKLQDNIEVFDEVTGETLWANRAEVDKAKIEFMRDQGKTVIELTNQQLENSERLRKQAEQDARAYASLVQSIRMEYLPALIAVHPATLAAAAATQGWRDRITEVDLAITANNDQIKAAQKEYDGMSEHLASLNKELGDMKTLLTELATPRLTGMGELDDKIAAVEKQIKRLQYAASTGLSMEEVARMFPIMKEGMEAYISRLPAAMRNNADASKIFLDSLKAMKDLKFDEQLDLIKKAAGETKKEMTFTDVMKSIVETKSKIVDLTGAVSAQEAAMKTQKDMITALQEKGEKLNDTLRGYQAELKLAEKAQKDLNEALELAFKWFMDDRDKIIEMGGAAAEFVPKIDAQMRTLLAGLDTYAKGIDTDISTLLQDAIDKVNALKAAIALLQGQLGEGGGITTSGYKPSGVGPAPGIVGPPLSWEFSLLAGLGKDVKWFKPGLAGGAFNEEINRSLDAYNKALNKATALYETDQGKALADLTAAAVALTAEMNRVKEEYAWIANNIREPKRAMTYGEMMDKAYADIRGSAAQENAFVQSKIAQLLALYGSYGAMPTETQTEYRGYLSRLRQAEQAARSGLPSMASGGIVPGPLGSARLILAHGGESVIPAGQSPVTVYVQNMNVRSDDDVKRVFEEVSKLIGRRASAVSIP